MTLPTKEELRSTIEGLRVTARKAKNDPQFAQEVLECLEERPLSKQPNLTPKQRSDQMLDRWSEAEAKDK